MRYWKAVEDAFLGRSDGWSSDEADFVWQSKKWEKMLSLPAAVLVFISCIPACRI